MIFDIISFKGKFVATILHVVLMRVLNNFMFQNIYSLIGGYKFFFGS